MSDLAGFQGRPLEPIYAIVFLDAPYVKMRHEGLMENRAVYVAIGVDMEGRKEVLGLWTSANEGAKFWLGVLTELRRGLKDVLIVCIDGLKDSRRRSRASFRRHGSSCVSCVSCIRCERA